MNRIVIVLYEGFDSLDAVGPWEVFRKAEQAGAPITVKFAAIDAKPTIHSSDDLAIAEHAEAGTCDADWILVPGGSWAAKKTVGAWGEIERGVLPAFLRARRNAGAKIMTVCTGAMIASAAGITKGRDVITHATAKEALAAEGANVIDARVVDDGDLVSSAGVSAGIDLALWMVERLASKEVAAMVKRTIEWDHAAKVHLGKNAR